MLGRNGADFQEIGGEIGNTIMPADPNGVRRRVLPHSYQGLRGFAVAMVEQGPAPPSRRRSSASAAR